MQDIYAEPKRSLPKPLPPIKPKSNDTLPQGFNTKVALRQGVNFRPYVETQGHPPRMHG